MFGNHIDTHVQLRMQKKMGTPESLQGSFYIIFTGEVDAASGLPIAHHPRGLSDTHDERCGVTVDCYVGWYIDAVPGAAKFLYHSGVNGDDHPVWMVNRAEEASAPAVGMVIPQPGYNSHFHWITTGSTDPRAGNVSDACDKANAGQLQNNGPTAVNEICEGWFLQLRAVRDFAFQHGGELIPVHQGEDLRTHLNLVTNYSSETGPDGSGDIPAASVPITPTRTSDGGH